MERIDESLSIDFVNNQRAGKYVKLLSYENDLTNTQDAQHSQFAMSTPVWQWGYKFYCHLLCDRDYYLNDNIVDNIAAAILININDLYYFIANFQSLFHQKFFFSSIILLLQAQSHTHVCNQCSTQLKYAHLQEEILMETHEKRNIQNSHSSNAKPSHDGRSLSWFYSNANFWMYSVRLSIETQTVWLSGWLLGSCIDLALVQP